MISCFAKLLEMLEGLCSGSSFDFDQSILPNDHQETAPANKLGGATIIFRQGSQSRQNIASSCFSSQICNKTNTGATKRFQKQFQLYQRIRVGAQKESKSCQSGPKEGLG